MQIVILLVYVVAIGAMMYFLAIKPQKKQQKEAQTEKRLFLYVLKPVRMTSTV